MSKRNQQIREPHVVLVDEHDNRIGTMPKLEAHRVGALHRAISVIIQNVEGQVLLQRRALGKYHSPGLWTNTACSHPLPGEESLEAAQRTLDFEMGIACPLRHILSFLYKADVGDGLVEHELDHVYVGTMVEGLSFQTNPDEVDGHRWASPADLTREMEIDGGAFTTWFKILWPKVLPLLEGQTTADELP